MRYVISGKNKACLFSLKERKGRNDTVMSFCFPCLQVMGAWSIRVALSARAHLVVRVVLPQRVIHRHGLPLHRLQHTARDVHLHLPLSPPEEGKRRIHCSLGYV